MLARQGAHYTAFELLNAPPYTQVGKIAQFENQLNACSPPVSGFGDLGIRTAAQTASGGYLIAGMNGAQAEIALFDANMSSLAVAPTNLQPLAFADVNGDGNLDLIGVTLGSDHTQTLNISLGNGTATFQLPASYQVGMQFESVFAVTVGDLNGDGKPDLIALIGGLGGNRVAVLPGNGDGSFQPQNTLFPNLQVGAVTTADLNGDEHVDLVLLGEQGGSNTSVAYVALGVGDGTFATPVPYAVGDATSVAVGDVNGDGIPDIVTGGTTILLGDGKGTFSRRHDLHVEVQRNIILTDFDGDGIVDIVLASGNSAIMTGDAVSVIRGLGKGAFAAPPISQIPYYPAGNTVLTDLATADADRDGIPDLVSVDNFGHVSVLKGAGDGTFSAVFSYNYVPGVPTQALFADFNHDGNPDLAVVGSGYTPTSIGEVDILLGKGNGTFASPTRITTALGAAAIATGDFNADGKLDFAVLLSQYETGSDGLQIFFGNGDGTFTAGTSYPAGPSAQSIVVGDFNRDGKLDLVVSNTGRGTPGNLSAYMGKGDGTFAAPMAIPIGGLSPYPYDLVSADFNHDGNLDIACTISGGLAIFLGLGDGNFQTPVYYAVNASTIRPGDIDGDGVPDLILSGAATHEGLAYMLGNGDGTFQPPIYFTSDSRLYTTDPFVIADFNGDGMLDVAGVLLTGVDTFLNPPQAAPAFSVVSAAGFTPGPITAGSIASAFGRNFPAIPALTVTDNTGTTLPASVVFSSGSQINFIVPVALSTGLATVQIGSQSAAIGIAPIAPAIFTLNDQGLAAAEVTSVSAAGVVTTTASVTFANGAYTSVPIDVSSGSTYLVLFGTGLRNASTLTATVGSRSAAVTYAGAQPSFAGLDQVNLLLPTSLAGSGCVNVTPIDGFRWAVFEHRLCLYPLEFHRASHVRHILSRHRTSVLAA